MNITLEEYNTLREDAGRLQQILLYLVGNGSKCDPEVGVALTVEMLGLSDSIVDMLDGMSRLDPDIHFGRGWRR